MDTRKDFVALINAISDLSNEFGKKALEEIKTAKDASSLLQWLYSSEIGYTDITLEECQRLIDNRTALVNAGTKIASVTKDGGY